MALPTTKVRVKTAPTFGILAPQKGVTSHIISLPRFIVGCAIQPEIEMFDV
jgi:hypothetical protein